MFDQTKIEKRQTEFSERSSTFFNKSDNSNNNFKIIMKSEDKEFDNDKL